MKHLVPYLKSVQKQAIEERHRRLVVLSGHPAWVQRYLDEQLPEINRLESLWVSDQKFGSALSCQNSVRADRLKAFLGQEFDQVIWDGFSGLNPDGIGIAGGLLKAGGLMFLCIPPLEELQKTPDPDYQRMCTQTFEMAECTTRFLTHLVSTFQHNEHLILIREGQEIDALGIDDDPETLNSLPGKTSFELSDEQQLAIDVIKQLAKGRAHRPYVIKANRGRGKSTALGIAAAEITKEQNKQVLITAPNEASCRIALRHFEANNGIAEKLSFIAPDELLRSHPKADVLLVDEAAAIPSPMLSALLSAYPRIVFSTTIHGYEGTGRGFAVKFQQKLDELTPQWRQLEIHQPTRWNPEDPLEQWLYDALMLDAEPAELKTTTDGTKEGFHWLDRDDFLTKPELLKQSIGLLVNAHYQTSPSDIRLILDHPAIRIGLYQYHDDVVGICLLIEEGGLEDDQLAQGIIEGKRKPKNHLVPQALTYCSAQTTFMKLKTWRVMRIAVHAQCQRLGIASRMLKEAQALAQTHEVDYLSSSFGLTAELLSFWEANKYLLVRVGRHKDAASGFESIIVAKPLNKTAAQYVFDQRASFVQGFEYALSHYHRQMDPRRAYRILNSLPFVVPQDLQMHIVKAFAYSHRAFEESALALLAFARHALFVDRSVVLKEEDQILLIAKLWQGYSTQDLVILTGLSGRKAVESRLRQIFVSLIEQGSKP